MPDTFYIPNTSERKGNRITKKDIEKRQLRVGVNNKKYFPSENSNIKINISNRSFNCKLDINNKDGRTRSYRLILGKEGMNQLNITEGDRVKITKITNFEYNLEKKNEFLFMIIIKELFRFLTK